MTRRAFATAAMLLCLGANAGCQSCAASLQDAKDTETAIKAELGVDSRVFVRTFSGSKGTKVTVSVKLLSTPAGDVASVKAKVQDIVTRTFKQHVDEVTVTF